MKRRVAVLIAQLDELAPPPSMQLGWDGTADVVAAHRWGVSSWEELFEPELEELADELEERLVRARQLMPLHPSRLPT